VRLALVLALVVLVVGGGFAVYRFVLAPVEPDETGPIVIIETSEGTIKARLFEKNAPITVKNFLTYVDEKFYDGTIFHRVIPNFMIQGGGMEPGERLKEKPTHPSIKNESSNGLLNKRGTLAMARTGDPDSATAQFFINVEDNGFLDRKEAPDGVGYVVFGRVIEGMDVVDRIRKVPRNRANNRPLDDVHIKSVRRAEMKKAAP
jgi:peptidyl-prolyl cis-trans isomerase B (cyclophilin B)